MSKETAIRFHAVTKRYYVDSAVAGGLKNMLLHPRAHLRAVRSRRPLCALSDVSLEVYRGECLSLIGHNGAGKSTALGLMAGVLRPSAGRVEAKGRICPLLELGAGFHPELSGRENIVLNGILLGLTRGEVLGRMSQIIAFAELASHIESPLRTYSSGMIARLGFSVAVHLDPDILLVDEVLAVGDASFQAKCFERIDRFRASGVTIVFVSHDLRSVARISDRVALLEHGRLVQIGEPDRVIPAYQQAVAA